MRPITIFALLLGLLLSLDVSSHLLTAYNDMLRALDESSKSETLLDHLGLEAR